MRSYGLSERELQVLTLIATGASNVEIAEALHLGSNTVKTYIRTAYRKIGLTRRAQAVIWGRDHGLTGQTSSGQPDISTPSSSGRGVPPGHGSRA